MLSIAELICVQCTKTYTLHYGTTWSFFFYLMCVYYSQWAQKITLSSGVFLCWLATLLGSYWIWTPLGATRREIEDILEPVYYTVYVCWFVKSSTGQIFLPKGYSQQVNSVVVVVLWSSSLTRIDLRSYLHHLGSKIQWILRMINLDLVVFVIFKNPVHIQYFTSFHLTPTKIH